MKTLARITRTKVITSQGTKHGYTVEMPYQVLGDELVNMFAGRPALSIDVLVDEQGKRITDIDALKKKGCVFAHLTVVRNLANERYCLKKVKGTKDPNPLLSPDVVRLETYDAMVLLNIIWENKVEKLIEQHDGNKEYKVKEYRSNKIENYKDSRVVCSKDDDFYLNYVVHSYMDNRKIYDENGRELTPPELEELNGLLLASYRKEVKVKSAEQQAEKMGIPVEALPDIRQMRMENIGRIRVFERDFIPVEDL